MWDEPLVLAVLQLCFFNHSSFHRPHSFFSRLSFSPACFQPLVSSLSDLPSLVFLSWEKCEQCDSSERSEDFISQSQALRERQILRVWLWCIIFLLSLSSLRFFSVFPVFPIFLSRVFFGEIASFCCFLLLSPSESLRWADRFNSYDPINLNNCSLGSLFSVAPSSFCYAVLRPDCHDCQWGLCCASERRS